MLYAGSSRGPRFACGVFAIALPLSAAALADDPIIITADTHISDEDTSLHNMHVIVRGATLTIDGVHPVNSLTVERNSSNMPGVVTHSPDFVNRDGYGLRLDVSGDVFIEGEDGKLVASRIDVTGRGYGPNLGPGAGAGSGASNTGAGGGHGGAGSPGTFLAASTGGGTYGSFAEPTTMGSGGGPSTGSGTGGGVIRLAIDGALVLDGIISANGTDSSGTVAGGGSGGSIWIDCGNFSGSGIVTAHGGVAASTGAGSGGGGRIAVYADSSSFDDANLRAWGGSGPRVGGAGTVYFQQSVSQPADLIIDNGGQDFIAATTEMQGEVVVPVDLYVRNGAQVGAPRGDDSLHLIVLGDVFVTADAGFNMDGRGYGPNDGPGAGTGTGASNTGAGGGHGGAGSPGSFLAASDGGGTYGSFTAPTTMGSGGGPSSASGNGGGVIRITVDGLFNLDGTISANGLSASGSVAGGGAGGSIWIDCGAFSGSGYVTAHGGEATSVGAGSGGGGRIAVYADSSSFDDANLRTWGGSGARVGGAGTVYFQRSIAEPARLIIDNGDQPHVAAVTEVSGTVVIDGDLLIRNEGNLGAPAGDDTLHVIVEGDALIEETGWINLAGRGYGPNEGPAAGWGTGASNTGAGGGHGGAGSPGLNLSASTGGSTYGSFTAPTTMGSGGGPSISSGSGGGVVRLTVQGALAVQGTITANGTDSSGSTTGGGAGGSIWIDCGEFSGDGFVTAHGGITSNSGAGSGGGGRIAVFADSSSFDDTHLQAWGGDGARTGGAGTVFYQASNSQPPTLIIDNGELPKVVAITEIYGENNLAGDLLVRRNGRFGPPAGDDSMRLYVAGDATVAGDGWIDAIERGYGPNEGPEPGWGTGASNTGAGGGHGGNGATGSNSGSSSGGGTYGSEGFPTTMGSGGGPSTSSGAGGGVIFLGIDGTLTVDGFISADGGGSTASTAGGGAGGSVFIRTGAIAGSGLISADGGIAENSGAGSGGGGRIAIYTCSVLISESQVTVESGGNLPGEAGTAHFLADSIELVKEPQDDDVFAGATVTFTVQAEGDGPLTYGWRFNGVLLDDDEHFSGTHTPVLTVSDVTCLDHSGQYEAVVTDSCGFVFSQPATLIVREFADLNFDCVVDVSDLLILLSNWGPCPRGTDCLGDLNDDGVVDVSDLLLLLSNWG